MRPFHEISLILDERQLLTRFWQAASVFWRVQIGQSAMLAMFLIAVVLLQTGKRADLAGAFGGGGSQTAFGTRGAATFLSRMTTVFAVLFMVLSLALSIYSSGGNRRTASKSPSNGGDPKSSKSSSSSRRKSGSRS